MSVHDNSPGNDVFTREKIVLNGGQLRSISIINVTNIQPMITEDQNNVNIMFIAIFRVHMEYKCSDGGLKFHREALTECWNHPHRRIPMVDITYAHGK